MTKKSITDRYIEFVLENPHVYLKLVDLGRVLLQRGFQRLGIGMLWETLRYTRMQTMDPNSDFKLNDHYRSRYARTIKYQEPDFLEAFELRELTSADNDEAVVFFWDGNDQPRYDRIVHAMGLGVSGVIVYPTGKKEFF